MMSYARMQLYALLAVGTFYFLFSGSVYSADEPVLIPMYSMLLGKSGTSLELVKHIDPGEGDAGPEDLYAWNGLLVFGTNDGVHGNEVWKSDGTAAGTVMVKDIHAGSSSSDRWSEGPSGTYGVDRDFTVMGDVVYFAATDGEHPPSLWKTDGTEAGTSEVNDVSPGNLIVFNGALYFAGTTGSGIFAESELWTSDGTESGTQMLKNIAEREDEGNSSYPGQNSGFTVFGDAFYFEVANVEGNPSPELCRLWKSDGTETGTVPVKSGVELSPTGVFAVCNNTLYFVAEDGTNGREIWKSDGSAAGTVMLAATDFSEPPGRFVEYGGSLYFRADDGTSGSELWKLDCTTESVTRVKDINPGSNGSYVEYLTVFNDSLYFTAEDNVVGDELWQTDGTEAGTTLVKDINPGPAGSSISSLTAYEGMLYFSADDGEHGDELWQSDGSGAGTALLKDINPGPEWSYPYEFTAVNGSLFFATAEESSTAWKLWRLRR